uniref:Uncharacterized protein n=1 Tax=Amorphochlora amoebiformis TaxID=1561963 RepID=A0A7S0CYN9_9EUKA|mmetsp:Transcript_15972/g.25292  ORF Transcript_15972/g.25292 Transcript_15972/m.25292 type:complete len:1112 (+) Transcript_15972:47-3382(+)
MTSMDAVPSPGESFTTSQGIKILPRLIRFYLDLFNPRPNGEKDPLQRHNGGRKLAKSAEAAQSRTEGKIDPLSPPRGAAQNMAQPRGSGIEGVVESQNDRKKTELVLAIERLGYDFLMLEVKPTHEADIQHILLKYCPTPRGERIIRQVLQHCLAFATVGSKKEDAKDATKQQNGKRDSKQDGKRSGMDAKEPGDGTEAYRLRANSLATLHNILYVILHHAVPRARPLDALDRVLGRGNGDTFARKVLRVVCAMLQEEATTPPGQPTPYHYSNGLGPRAGLKVLICMASASLNLHQNPLLELFYTEKVFNVLTLLVSKHDHAKNLPLDIRAKIMVIMLPLIHFKRYEAHNTGLEVVTKRLSVSQLHTFDQTLQSIIRLAMHLFADLPPNLSPNPNNQNISSKALGSEMNPHPNRNEASAAQTTSSYITTGIRSSVGAFIGLMGHILGPDPNPATPPPTTGPRSNPLAKNQTGRGSRGAIKGVRGHRGPSGQSSKGTGREGSESSSWEMTTERCFRKARHCLVDLSLFILHVMLKDNKRYLIRLAKIKRKNKTPSTHSIPTSTPRSPNSPPRRRLPQHNKMPQPQFQSENGQGRESSQTSGQAALVEPTQAAVTIERYLCLVSVLLQQPLGPRALLSGQLCVAVAHRMSQDVPANVLLFAAGSRAYGRGKHVCSFRRNANTGELIRPDASFYDIKVSPYREGKWECLFPGLGGSGAGRSADGGGRGNVGPGGTSGNAPATSATGGAAVGGSSTSDNADDPNVVAAPPLATVLFRTVVKFLKRQIPGLTRLRDGGASLIVVVLDVLYRHFTYHLHTPLDDKAATPMAEAYLQLGKTLIHLIIALGMLPRLEKPPPANLRKAPNAPADPLLQALYQSAHFLHLLLCVRGQVFPGGAGAGSGSRSGSGSGGGSASASRSESKTKTNYTCSSKEPRSRLLFELTRNETELEKVRKRLAWAPIVQDELSAVASAAEAIDKLLDGELNEEHRSGALPKITSIDHDHLTDQCTASDRAEKGLASKSRIGHGLSPEEVRGLVRRWEGELHVAPLVPSRQVRETAVFDARTDQRFFNQTANCILQEWAMMYLCGAGGTSAAMSEEETHWEDAGSWMEPPSS